eukprot:scaffold28278_cov37-Prasinocladus_malaysianus.AAC.1
MAGGMFPTQFASPIWAIAFPAGVGGAGGGSRGVRGAQAEPVDLVVGGTRRRALRRPGCSPRSRGVPGPIRPRPIPRLAG